MMSDWELISRARGGDESAWTALIARHRSRLLKLSLLMTGDPQSADDVVQDTFVRLLDYGEEKRGASFAALASTIAYRFALKERQRAVKHYSFETANPQDLNSSPLDSVLRSERDRELVQALLGLDDAHRDILILRFYGEHSYAEIARLTGAPLGTVKSRIFYGVKQCRKQLMKKGLLP
jgi:RNA polymerase sigma-70 factor (ECF subfamily)